MRRFALLSLAAFFIGAGANHFMNSAFYVGIMPRYLPAHLELVYASGLLEMMGGGAIIFRRTRATGCRGLILLLIAVFPANLNMALHVELFPETSIVLLVARLPIQLLLMAWVHWVGRPDVRSTES